MFDFIRPSLLSANFLNLDSDLKMIDQLQIRNVHYDVMDGLFVKKISFGQNIYKEIKESYPQINFDVHLMTKDPLEKVNSFITLGCKEIAMHYECIKDVPLQLLTKVINENKDVKFGISLNPNTDPTLIYKYLNLFSYVLVMSVFPGEGGQEFINSSLEKISKINNFRLENRLKFLIMVDGGINETTGRECLKSGADVLICGSSFFKSTNKLDFLNSFKKVRI